MDAGDRGAFEFNLFVERRQFPENAVFEQSSVHTGNY